MANLLIFIELVEGKPHPGSLEVLGQARRIGTRLGASVYAIVASVEPDDEALRLTLSRHGADKVLLGSLPIHRSPATFDSHGETITAACDRLPPTLLLFADSPAARDIAPRMAARVDGAFVPDAWVEVTDGDKIVLWEGSGADAFRHEGALDFTVVLLIPSGRYQTALGDDCADASAIEIDEPTPSFREMARS